MSGLTCVCVCVCVCVCELTCVCVCARAYRGRTPLCAYRACECNVTETEITRRCVNKTNNVRLFSLFNKRTRYRPVLLER